MQSQAIIHQTLNQFRILSDYHSAVQLKCHNRFDGVYNGDRLYRLEQYRILNGQFSNGNMSFHIGDGSGGSGGWLMLDIIGTGYGCHWVT